MLVGKFRGTCQPQPQLPLGDKNENMLCKLCFAKRKDCICRGMPSFLTGKGPPGSFYVLILSSCLYLALAFIAGRSGINRFHIITIAIIDISLGIHPICIAARHSPILGFTVVGCSWFRPGFNGGPTITGKPL